jgi:hypothetical protein
VIEENMDAQRRLWAVQRVGRAIAVLLMALGLAGVFGGGPLSHATSSSGGSSVEYERIGYRDTPQTYRVVVSPDLAQSAAVRVWLGSDTLRSMKLDGVVPEPRGSTAAHDRVVFEFDVGGDGGPAEILFEVQPTGPGVFTSRLGVERGPTFEVTQVVLP